MKTGVVNVIFWSEIGSKFWELGGTPHQEFPGVPGGRSHPRSASAEVEAIYL